VGRRHAGLIERALTALAEARRAWDAQAGGELVMIDLRQTLEALDEVLGLSPDEAVLNRIFDKFCLGK
jgi:tRNA modification GTPase